MNTSLPTRPPARKIIVIGAGIVGSTIALRLLRDGHDVTLLDPDPPGSGTSYGNAGSLSPGSIVPLALPGTLRSIPGWLADPLGPLSVSVARGPFLLPWLYRFWRAGRQDRVVPIVRAMQSLNRHCVTAYEHLLADAGAPELLAREGMLHVFRSEQAFAASAMGRQLRTDHGVQVELMDAAAIRRHSPALADGYQFGFFLADGGHVRNPQRVVTSLVGRFQSLGGQVLAARARELVIQRDKVIGVRTDEGELQAEDTVLAAGIGSVQLAQQLRVSVPVIAERGYHVQFNDPGLHLSRPVTDAQAKCVATPMEEGLRIAGTSEFTSAGARPNWKRADVLVRNAVAMYPGLKIHAMQRWAGSRPSTPDSLPVICPAPQHQGAFLAFGHGHWGLMAAPATAQLVADMIARRPSSSDISSFHVNRF